MLPKQVQNSLTMPIATRYNLIFFSATKDCFSVDFYKDDQRDIGVFGYGAYCYDTRTKF